MALNSKTRVIGRNAALDAVLDVLNGGKLRIYDGTQPTDADTAIGAQVLLADLALNATFGAAASSGTKTANSITADSSADATGTASWFSLLTSANVRVIDGSVGTSGANLNLNSVAISSGATVSVTALTVTMAA
jgi:hypothetical protein